MAAYNANRHLGINLIGQAKSMEKLSSGVKINSGADDAAGLAVSEQMRTQIGGLQTASQNGQLGITLLQVADGALSEVHSILQRMRDLALQSLNDTYTSDDRSKMNDEFKELEAEIKYIMKNTEYNSMDIFDETFTFQVGANGGQTIEADLSDMDYDSLSTGSLNIRTTVNATAALTGLDNAIDLISEYRATIGAVESRLEHRVKNVDNTAENLQEAESLIRDTDMALEMVQYTKFSILAQASQSMLSQSNQNSNNVLLLLL